MRPVHWPPEGLSSIVKKAMVYDMNPPQNVMEDWTYTPIVSLFLVHTEVQYLFVRQYWTVLLP